MKKFAITLCVMGILGAASSASAYVFDSETSTVPFLKSSGYSTPALHAVNTVKTNNSIGKSESYYNLDPYAECNTGTSKWYTVVKRWLDPIQDDELFGRHEITYTNGWFENDPSFVGKNKVQYDAPSQRGTSESL